MATQVDRYLVEIQAKLIGDEVFATLTSRIKALESENQKLRASLQAAGVGIQNVAAQGKNAAAGIGKLQGVFQNVSYQLTDFVVQTSGGVSALRAFSQQAPQVAGALGAAGIGGAAGVAAFAIASLAAALAPVVIALIATKDEAELLAEELKTIEDRQIDFKKILGNAKESEEILKNLTAAGKELAGTLQGIGAAQDAQKMGLLRDQIKLITKDMLDFQLVFSKSPSSLGSQYYLDTIEKLNKQLGITLADAGKIGPLLRQALSPTPSAESAQALSEVIAFFTALKNSGDSSENVTKLIQALEQLLELQVKANKDEFALPEPDKEAANRVKALNREWQTLSDSLRTSKEVFDDQIADIKRLGEELGKTEAETQKLIDAATKEYGESEFKRLTKDTETFVGGVYASVAAVDSLSASTEYLAGVRQMLSQFPVGSEEWVAIAGLLGESATNMERIQAAVGQVRNDTKSDQTLRQEWEKFKGTIDLTAEEIKKVEKALFDTKDTAKDLTDSIGIAIGQTLSRQVGRFVDTLFDAKASFSDMAASMLEDIAKLIVEMTILASIKSSLAGTDFGNFLGIESASAKGNVFNKGNVVPFARGGVVSRPTVFPMANGGIGLMGEAGPEAIMPLKRGPDGKLGVSGGGVTVNVLNYTNAEAKVEETTDADGSVRIDVIIENAVDSAISRGRFDKSLGNIYGVRRRGA